tara:strand:+ start:1389 stop:1862 length:474 start_codon:yes stop_codon:yes gene_type:complete
MRKKKEPTFAYGIEITKPHSKEMYDHNDMVAEEMKTNILNKWEALISNIDKDLEWEDVFSDNSSIVKLQKLVCFSGYGSGYTVGDVDKEFRRELEMMQNYSIHEEYSYGSFERLLPRTKYMMVGFDWAKHDYGTELINDPHVKVVNKVVDRLMKDSI